LRVRGSRFRVLGLGIGLRIEGSGFRVERLRVHDAGRWGLRVYRTCGMDSADP
jgi:hypothetical protein